MKTLVIYDNEGYIISMRSGSPEPRKPIGVPYLYVEIPKGKRVVSVDTSLKTHKMVLEDIEKTELELIKEDIELLKTKVENEFSKS